MPIYKNKNGKGYKVRINYTDDFGRHRSITRSNEKTTSLKGAKEYEAELIKEMSKLQNSNINDKMTFEELCHDYMKVKAIDVKRNTMRKTEQSVRLFLIPFFGKIKVEKISIKHINEWKLSISNKDYSVEYLNTILACLKKILNYGVATYNFNYQIVKNLTRFKDANNLEDIEEEIRYWTYDQFLLFYKAIEQDLHNATTFQNKLKYSNYLTFYSILYFTGVRKGEAYCLTWNKIINNQFKINLSMNQKVTPFEITSPKNKSSIRKIPICDFLKKRLEEHKKLFDKVYMFSNDWFICGGINPLKDTAIENNKNKYSKIVNIPQIKIHEFRHSFASLLINFDINIKTISKLMGHSSVDQTWNTYGHLYPEKTNEAITKINEITM